MRRALSAVLFLAVCLVVLFVAKCERRSDTLLDHQDSDALSVVTEASASESVDRVADAAHSRLAVDSESPKVRSQPSPESWLQFQYAGTLLPIRSGVRFELVSAVDPEDSFEVRTSEDGAARVPGAVRAGAWQVRSIPLNLQVLTDSIDLGSSRSAVVRVAPLPVLQVSVRDRTGVPIEGAHIELSDPMGTSISGSDATARDFDRFRTNRSGLAEIGRVLLPTGSRVRVAANGFFPCAVTPIVDAGEGSLSDPLVVRVILTRVPDSGAGSVRLNVVDAPPDEAWALYAEMPRGDSTWAGPSLVFAGRSDLSQSIRVPQALRSARRWGVSIYDVEYWWTPEKADGIDWSEPLDLSLPRFIDCRFVTEGLSASEGAVRCDVAGVVSGGREGEVRFGFGVFGSAVDSELGEQPVPSGSSLWLAASVSNGRRVTRELFVDDSADELLVTLDFAREAPPSTISLAVEGERYASGWISLRDGTRVEFVPRLVADGRYEIPAPVGIRQFTLENQNGSLLIVDVLRESTTGYPNLAVELPMMQTTSLRLEDIEGTPLSGVELRLMPTLVSAQRAGGPFGPLPLDIGDYEVRLGNVVRGSTDGRGIAEVNLPVGSYRVSIPDSALSAVRLGERVLVSPTGGEIHVRSGRNDLALTVDALRPVTLRFPVEAVAEEHPVQWAVQLDGGARELHFDGDTARIWMGGGASRLRVRGASPDLMGWVRVPAGSEPLEVDVVFSD